MFNKVLKAIREHETIIIHRHSRPDGDALGSQIGLKEAIKAIYPRKKSICGRINLIAIASLEKWIILKIIFIKRLWYLF